MNLAMLPWAVACGMWMLSSVALADECSELCTDLDTVEEACEAEFGDGDTLCEAIGAVEETCETGEDDDADDEGEADDDGDVADDGASEADDEDEVCEDLCESIDALDDACDTLLGEDHDVCVSLNELADGDCEDEDEADDEDEDEDEAEDDDEADDEEGRYGNVEPNEGGVAGDPGAPVTGCQTSGSPITVAFAAISALALRRRRTV